MLTLILNRQELNKRQAMPIKPWAREKPCYIKLHLTKRGGFGEQDFEFYKSFPGLVSLD